MAEGLYITRYPLDAYDDDDIPSGMSLQADYVFNDEAGVFTDESADAANTVANDVAITRGPNNYFYVGNSLIFHAIYIDVGTPAPAGTRQLEYWDGTSWVAVPIALSAYGLDPALPFYAIYGGNVNLTTDLQALLHLPGWQQTTVNGQSAYWIRFASTSASGSAGTINSISVGVPFEWEPTIYLPGDDPDKFVFDFYYRIFARTDEAHTLLNMMIKWEFRGQIAYNASQLLTTVTQTGESVPVEIQSRTSLVPYNLHPLGGIPGPVPNSVPIKISVSFISGGVASGSCKLRNVCGNLLLTQYADTDTSGDTRIKTASFILNGGVDLSVGVPYTAIDSIPALNSLLPENDVVVRSAYLEIRGETHDAAADAAVISFELYPTSGPALSRNFRFPNDLLSNTAYRLIWELDLDPTKAYDLNVLGTGMSTSYAFSVVLWVTYEYNHTSSTRILNSLEMPLVSIHKPLDSVNVGGTNMPLLPGLELLIAEPGVIQNGNIGLLINATRTSTAAANLAVNLNNLSEFIITSSAVNPSICGNHSWSRRWDSVLPPLSRGFNTFNAQARNSLLSATQVYLSFSAMLYLNYISDKHPDGVEVHNRTIVATVNAASAWTNTILDTGFYNVANNWKNFNFHYFINNVGNILTFPTALGSVAFEVWTRPQGNATPLYILGSGGFTTIAERAPREIFLPYEKYKRYEGDPKLDAVYLTRNIDTGREASSGVLVSTPAVERSYIALITYHRITFQFTGTVYGYTGDGSGITVNIFRSDTNRIVGEVTTEIGGTYTFTWYDDTVPLYAVARQGDGYVGRSNDGLASEGV